MSDEATSTCEVCGKVLKRQGLGPHMALAHGVRGKQQRKGRRQAGCIGRRGPTRRATAGDDIQQTVARAIADIQQIAAVADQCIAGLDKVVGEVARLRRGYVEKADKLRRLGAEINSVREAA